MVRTDRARKSQRRRARSPQLETEQYFSTLYKTQVKELQDEVEEAKQRNDEIEQEKEHLGGQLQEAGSFRGHR